MRLHLVGATYELFRHFYAVPSRKAPDGREVGQPSASLRSAVAAFRLTSFGGIASGGGQPRGARLDEPGR